MTETEVKAQPLYMATLEIVEPFYHHSFKRGVFTRVGGGQLTENPFDGKVFLQQTHHVAWLLGWSTTDSIIKLLAFKTMLE